MHAFLCMEEILLTFVNAVTNCSMTVKQTLLPEALNCLWITTSQ